MLVEVPDAVECYRFSHALMRETLYEELSAPRRVQLHLEIGEAIEARADADEHVVEIAHHFFEVGRKGEACSDPGRMDQGENNGAQARSFRHEGDYWTIAHDGTELRLKDSRGLQYLVQLLRHAGQEFLALDLIATGFPTRCGRPSLDTGPLLDAQAKAAYKQRLDELRDKLHEAEAHNDLGRAAHAREEIDFISEQLAAAVGLNGKDRPGPSPAERARQTVTKGIKSVIVKVRAGNPGLGRYLAATVTTGCFCAYRPDADQPVTWSF